MNFSTLFGSIFARIGVQSNIPNQTSEELGGTFWMPEAATAAANDTDALFYFIGFLCIFFFILIVGAMALFVFKYRDRGDSNHKTSAIKGNHTLEVIWSVIPGILLGIIFYWGYTGWLKNSVVASNAMEVRVTGFKWAWKYDYQAQGVLDVSELVLPVNRPVKLLMSSEDVLHSFFVPAFRVKRDVLPGRYTVLGFTPNKKGKYLIECAEFCGDSHSQMRSFVRVVSQEEFDKWIDNDAGRADLDPVAYGQKVFDGKCASCHSLEGQKGTGPALDNLVGREEQTDKGAVMVDKAYIIESIKEPGAKIVAGYGNQMTPFPNLNDKQLNGLYEFLKSKSKHAGAADSREGAEPEKSMAPDNGERPAGDSEAPVEGGTDGEDSSSSTEGEKLKSKEAAKASDPKQTEAFAKGKKVFQMACMACHAAEGQGGPIGPKFDGLFGSEIEVADGPKFDTFKKITVDENYIKDSIEKPNAQKRKGFHTPDKVMVLGPLNADQMDDIIFYIKSIGTK